MEKSFDEIYEKIYSENNEELEKIRQWNEKVDKKRTKATSVTIILIVVISIFFVNIIKNSNNELLIMSSAFLFPASLILGFIPVAIVCLSTSKKVYYRLYKERVIKEIIKYLDSNLEYHMKTSKDPDFIYKQYNRGGYEIYNRYTADDYIEGMLDAKYNVRMAEIHTKIEVNDAESTVFHGIFCNTESAKNINTTLKVCLNKGILEKDSKKKWKLEMDSEEFEKYFDVYTENNIIAMQILTTDVMEIMLEFTKKYQIMYDLTIRDNQIYIRFHTGKVFEPKVFTDLLDYDLTKRYYDIIEFIFKVSREINKVIENTEI